MSSRTASGSRRYRSTTLSRSRPLVDHLESRALLSTTVAHPTFVLEPFAGGGGPPSAAFTPAQLQAAYGFNSISFNGVAGTGKGETIAIVDAYDDPNIQSDLNTFDTEFGLPAIDGHPGQRDRRDELSRPAIRRAAGSSKIARRRVGARDGARGEHHAGRGQLGQRYRPARRRQLCGGACECRVDELGRRRVLGRDGVRQHYFDKPAWRSWLPRATRGAPAAVAGGFAQRAVRGRHGPHPGAATPGRARPAGAAAAAARARTSRSRRTRRAWSRRQSTARATPDVAYDASPSTGVAVYDSVPYEGTTLRLGPGWRHQRRVHRSGRRSWRSPTRAAP